MCLLGLTEIKIFRDAVSKCLFRFSRYLFAKIVSVVLHFILTPLGVDALLLVCLSLSFY